MPFKASYKLCQPSHDQRLTTATPKCKPAIDNVISYARPLPAMPCQMASYEPGLLNEIQNNMLPIAVARYRSLGGWNDSFLQGFNYTMNSGCSHIKGINDF